MPAAGTMHLAPDGEASVLHTDKTVFDPRKMHQSRTFSSAVERRLDMADAGGSIPSRCTTSGVDHETAPTKAGRRRRNHRRCRGYRAADTDGLADDDTPASAALRRLQG